MMSMDAQSSQQVPARVKLACAWGGALSMLPAFLALLFVASYAYGMRCDESCGVRSGPYAEQWLDAFP
jgi:hypothetical protein